MVRREQVGLVVLGEQTRIYTVNDNAGAYFRFQINLTPRNTTQLTQLT